MEKLKQQISQTVKKTGLESSLDLVADSAIRTVPPPSVEWWDAQLLPNNSYEDFDNGLVVLDDNNILVTNLIQHPVPIQPPHEVYIPRNKGVMLTKKETKKIRRLRRLEEQKEKQDKIRLGILPPDQPKMKMSNFMSVLGDDAIMNPTTMDKAVQSQVQRRAENHLKANAER